MLKESEVAVLYRRHAASVFRRAAKLLGSDSEAHEIVQNVFLSLFERPEQFAGRSSMTTFLYSMTTNACLVHLRNQRNRERLLHEWHEQGTNPSIGQGFTLEQRMMLQESLANLPSEIAEATVYYVLDGLSHEEIARILHCSRRQVGDLLSRLATWERSQEEALCCNN